jgi:hypothetical protein
MKNCLITGGGSKFGTKLTDALIFAGYHVYLITGTPDTYLNNSNVTVIPVNWKTLSLTDLRSLTINLPNLDLIFFNHNSSALNRLKFSKNQIQSFKDWQQNYFIACQFPFYLIHTINSKINKTSKIGWMLSELIKTPGSNQIGFADYIGNKFTNACIMKSFSQEFPATFFGINPDSVSQDSNADIGRANSIIKLIDTTDPEHLNGKILYSTGDLFDF